MMVGSAANPSAARSSPSRCSATASCRLAVTSSRVSPCVTTAISSHVATYPDSASGVIRAWMAVRSPPSLIRGIVPRGQPRSERQVILLVALRWRGAARRALRVRTEADLVRHDRESRLALAVPLPGVLAQAAVDEQEVALRLVLGERLARLAVDLYVHEHRLVAALAVAREAAVRGQPQVGHGGAARQVLELGVGHEAARQRHAVEIGHRHH